MNSPGSGRRNPARSQAARTLRITAVAAILLAGGGVAWIFQVKGGLPFQDPVANIPQCIGSLLHPDFQVSLNALVGNGFLLGACLLACDPATSPRGNWGKVLYGIMIGAFAVLFRSFSNYHEGILCAILIGNLFSPTIDTVLRSRPDRSVSDEEQ